ncbi:MAG: hypothetical protein R2911_23685 [Caldilineaceae bacterium]
MNQLQNRNGKALSVLVVALSVVAAGVTFLFKLYEFVAASTTGIVPGIVTATVLPYFFVSGGFLLLAGWAWAGGHYKNIEQPKPTCSNRKRSTKSRNVATSFFMNERGGWRVASGR